MFIYIQIGLIVFVFDCKQFKEILSYTCLRENNKINCFKMRMDLSAIPEDIIPIIATYY